MCYLRSVEHIEMFRYFGISSFFCNIRPSARPRRRAAISSPAHCLLAIRNVAIMPIASKKSFKARVGREEDDSQASRLCENLSRAGDKPAMAICNRCIIYLNDSLEGELPSLLLVADVARTDCMRRFALLGRDCWRRHHQAPLRPLR